MLELLRLFPCRPVAITVASWVFFFVLQRVGVLTYATAVVRYDAPPNESCPCLSWDWVWFIYTELPRVLPMAAVFAVCMVLATQLVGRFIAPDNPDNLTIAQWLRMLREDPLRAVMWMGPRLALLFGVITYMVSVVVNFPRRGSVRSWRLLVLLALVQLLLPPWLRWILKI